MKVKQPAKATNKRRRRTPLMSRARETSAWNNGELIHAALGLGINHFVRNARSLPTCRTHNAESAMLYALQKQAEYVRDRIESARTHLNAVERLHALDVGEFTNAAQLELDCTLASIAAVANELKQRLWEMADFAQMEFDEAEAKREAEAKAPKPARPRKPQILVK